MKLSVALCTYNGALFIREQLASIIAQSRPVDEIVVYDDCSTDATAQIVHELLQGGPFQGRLLRNEQNVGAIRAFEKCIQACSGDVIFLADQDDIWLPEKVARLTQAFAADASTLAVFSNGRLIDETGVLLGGTLWEKWGFTPALQKQWRNNDFAFAELVPNRNVITGATLAFRRDLLPSLLPFELPAGYWHDAWIGLVAAGQGGLRFVTEPTIEYRIHGRQQVGTTAGAGDRKFEAVPREQFVAKVAGLFPRKHKLIYAPKPSLPRRIINRLKRVLR